SASDGDTPSLAAIEPTSDGLTTSLVGSAPLPLEGAVDTISAVPVLPGVADALAPAPWRVVPAMSTREGSRPLAAASVLTLTPSRAAIALSVSPRWTQQATLATGA